MLGPLSAFSAEPQKVYFENQEEGEVIVLLLRAHIVTLVPAAILVLILAIVPVLILALQLFLNVSLRLNFLISLSTSAILVLTFVYYLSLAFFSYLRFLLWYFNIYLVTNQRMIDFDFYGFLYKSISEAQLSKVQDVTSKISGPSQTFFNYGNVFIQTASERPMFVFENVPKPDEVAKEITEQVRLGEGEQPRTGI